MFTGKLACCVSLVLANNTPPQAAVTCAGRLMLRLTLYADDIAALVEEDKGRGVSFS